MNIIRNSCISSFIKNSLLHEEFTNPFVWSLIDFTSMYYLIQNFRTINFKSYTAKLTDNYVTIVIDKCVIVKYVHYKFDPNLDKPTKKDIDIFYKDILTYAVEKYHSRLNKMLSLNEDPIFVLANGFNKNLNNVGYYTLSECKAIQDLHSEFKIYMAYDYLFDNKLNNGNLILIKNIVPMNCKGANYNLAKLVLSKFNH